MLRAYFKPLFKDIWEETESLACVSTNSSIADALGKMIATGLPYVVVEEEARLGERRFPSIVLQERIVQHLN